MSAPYDRFIVGPVAPVDVLAVWDEARRFARDQSTSYETPYHLFTAMDEARAAVEELMESAPALMALYRLKWGNLDADAVAVYDRFEAALARCKGEK